SSLGESHIFRLWLKPCQPSDRGSGFLEQLGPGHAGFIRQRDPQLLHKVRQGGEDVMLGRSEIDEPVHEDGTYLFIGARDLAPKKVPGMPATSLGVEQLVARQETFVTGVNPSALTILVRDTQAAVLSREFGSRVVAPIGGTTEIDRSDVM